MVEKINALCRVIDTINDLPHSPKRVEIVNTLVDMLIAECKKMVNPPTVAAPTTRSAQAEDIFPERVPSPPTTYQKNHPDLGDTPQTNPLAGNNSIVKMP